MAEAIEDMKQWMSSESSQGGGSVDHDDDAPVEIKFEEGRTRAATKRRIELESKLKQRIEKKQKRKDIEQRNIVQKKTSIVELPSELLDQITSEDVVKSERQKERKSVDKQKEAKFKAKQAKRKLNQAKKEAKLSLPETTYEFIPLAGIAKIPNELIYKNKKAAVELNFKEKMLFNKKRVHRQKTGHVLAVREKQRHSKLRF